MNVDDRVTLKLIKEVLARGSHRFKASAADLPCILAKPSLRAGHLKSLFAEQIVVLAG
jgi:hypothetical protein